MNSDEQSLAHLEAELRRLCPVEVDAPLQRRIAKCLEAPPTATVGRGINTVVLPQAPVKLATRNLRRLAPWAAAAAVGAVTANILAPKAPPQTRPLTLSDLAVQQGFQLQGNNRPVNQKQAVSFIQDGGVHVDSRQGPVRRIQFQLNNQQIFRDAATGAQWQAEYPSVETIEVPILFH
jgi:hypothetical protein